MKAFDCCKTMEAELSAWKAILYDITRKMDKLPGGAKEKILSNIEDLHILVEELDERVENIRQNCSPETGIADIRSERQSFEERLSHLRVKADDAMQVLGAGNFGG
jgi:hypothetical protein